jgi:DNA mismatch endonuclease (patch repair protein)
VFSRARVVVFIDGCWWHSCPIHGSRPARNGDWWAAKLMRTQERDCANTAALEACGWSVVRVWEHEDVPDAVARIRAAIESAERGGPTRT